jgi:hypothetical protein
MDITKYNLHLICFSWLCHAGKGCFPFHQCCLINKLKIQAILSTDGILIFQIKSEKKIAKKAGK